MTEPQGDLQRNAITEQQRLQASQFQRAVDIKWLDSRMESSNLNRCLALIARERAMEKGNQERSNHAAQVNAVAKREADLAYKIESIRRQRKLDYVAQQRIRINDPEVRDEIHKAMCAQYAIDLKQQIIENGYRRFDLKKGESAAERMLSCFQCNSKEVDQEAEQKDREAKDNYREVLQQQLVNTLKEKQCQYENKLVEKKRLDDVLRTIYDEDVRELKLKEDSVAQLRKDMETSKLAKNSWREKQKMMIIAEEKQIEEYERKMQDRSSSEKEEKAKRQAAREAMNMEVGMKIIQEKLAKDERNNIISSIQQHEYIEKALQDDIAKKLKVKAASDDMISSLNTQISNHKAEADKLQMEDNAYREVMMVSIEAAKLKDEEEKNMAKAKQKIYAAELLQQIEDNKKRRERERRLNM